ncbi:MAG: hypothetical protein GXX85_09670 [Ignavibacteria bacterium]|nr:hypothetical protein [Ignavibacteria bacterium]
MKYHIGIDAGASKSKLVMTNDSLKKIIETKGGAANILKQGKEKSAETICNLILKSLKIAKITNPEIECITVGAAGAGRKSDANEFQNILSEKLEEKNINFSNLFIISDAEAALEGAFNGGPGCILISGTGSIAYGKDPNGIIIRVGGFGRNIGDEGSGFSIGSKGINEFSKQIDGRHPKTILFDIFSLKLKISSSEDLINLVYSSNYDLSSAAPLVIESAEKKDRLCLQILNDEVDELLSHIRTVKSRIAAPSMKLCLSGSILNTNNYFSKIFRQKIKLLNPEIVIIEPAFPPEIGAIVYGLKSKPL